MNEPKKQHYVPQVYLKFFSQKRDKKWEITVIDKKRKSPYNAMIDDIAFEKNFYTVDELGTPPYAWEYFYRDHVEPLIGTTFTQFITKCTSIFAGDGDVVLDRETRSALSKIIVAQLLRTPKARSQHYEICSDFFPTALGNILQTLEPYISIDQKNNLSSLELDDMFKKTDMQFATDPARLERFAQIIYDKYWVVCRNDIYKYAPFVTSDHPVLQYNLSTKSTSLQQNGIARPQTIIYYPLNPQLILVIYDEFGYQTLDGKLVVISEKDFKYIMTMNHLQYEQCTQHVYLIPWD